MKKHTILNLIISCMSLSFLSACDDSSSSNQLAPFDGIAAVQTKGEGESQVEFTDGKTKIQSGYLAKLDTDYAVFSNGEYLYQLGKGTNDSIQKYHVDNPELGYYPNDGYILREADQSANPHEIAFLNDSTAIITRYGQTESWVVNVNAQSFDEFVIETLDLSHHADNTNTLDADPEADMVFISGDKAFISMQNLSGWTADNTAKVAVFDTTTWQEIDTDPSTDGVQALSLSLKNHQSGAIHNNKIYLGSLVYGAWGTDEPNTGGIEVINTDTLETSVLTDEKAIWKIAVDDQGKVFFADYDGWQSNSLFVVNSDNSIGLVSEELSGLFITTLASPGDSIWLATSSSDPEVIDNQIRRIDSSLDFSEPKPLSEVVLSTVETALQTINIAFLDTDSNIPTTD